MFNKQWPTRLQNPPGRSFFSETPQVVGVEISGRCQLRCRHCFNLSGPDNPQELPLAVIERLLDEMQTWGVDHIRLSGGEPTYHRQFKEIINACCQRDISIAINTHGVYSAALLDYLKTAPIDLFLISVDGLEENNDAIRGSGTFQRAIRSCRQLHSAGQKVLIGFHVGMVNQTDVKGLITLAAEIGVDIKLAPIRPIGRAVEELSDALLQPEHYLALVKDVTTLRHQFPCIKILTDYDILDGLPTGDCQRDLSRASCKAGRSMININYDGGIYACAFFITPAGEFSAGNIYHDSISKVWQESPIFQPFRIHQKSGTCQVCNYYQNRCAGGCPAIAHFTTGCIDAHDPTCFVNLVDISEPTSAHRET